MNHNYIIKENEIYLLDEKQNKIAFVTFPKVSDNVVIIDHTVVSESLRGQGIARELLDNVYDYLKKTNRKARLSCSYARVYFEKNPAKRDVLEEEK